MAKYLSYRKPTVISLGIRKVSSFVAIIALCYITPLGTDAKIRVVDSLFDMTPQNQADWLQTMAALQLVDEGGARCQSCKDIYLKVPAGSEKYRVQTLAQHPAASWAELNCLRQISR